MGRHERGSGKQRGFLEGDAGGAGGAAHPWAFNPCIVLHRALRPMQRQSRALVRAAGASGAAGDDGGFLEATLAGLAAPAELAAAAAPRIPAHNLRILAQVAARDPMLLMAIGTTKEARGPVCQGPSWPLTNHPGPELPPQTRICPRLRYLLRALYTSCYDARGCWHHQGGAVLQSPFPSSCRP